MRLRTERNTMLKKWQNGSKVYYIGGALITMSGFFISLAVTLAMLVEFINPVNNFYPNNLTDYRERYAVFDDNHRVTGYRYSEEEIKAMFEEERESNLQQRKADNVNALVVGVIILLASGGAWRYFHGRLKK